ncbi:putative toxin-antitoxin system toxin component, PIN family [Adhaeribacter pallidiroseus]|uniref:PIN domain-containing protein n=1 Tax=Adhaeribacter pallidiroseus TaxID=2072847 RepID=A0A369QQS4_9BACT|nr:putative toxin-antitoxin system toxin component, PIN family [Adhaeribacter pallidiroseus]RDC65646.1 hypothetical protein AHMF7616_04276 [Adhaeribacter pallidiroseus]
MQKIILDTNVIVSALISNSVPTKILYNLVFKQLVNPCLLTEIFTEYIEVLGREKFSRIYAFKIKAEVVLAKLKDLSSFYQTNRKVEVLTDTSDNKFLELAAVSSADYLITGNTLDFTITEFEYTKIVTPREYWDNYKP